MAQCHVSELNVAFVRLLAMDCGDKSESLSAGSRLPRGRALAANGCVIRPVDRHSAFKPAPMVRGACVRAGPRPGERHGVLLASAVTGSVW